MARPFEQSSNYFLNKSDHLLKQMAHFGGETSNRLFQTLEEWNEFLKKYAPFFKEVA